MALAVELGQAQAFRLARHGLTGPRSRGIAEAAACPASDFARDAALLALGARADAVTRAGFDAATEAGEVVLAATLRAAIHALAPDDFARYGRGLLADDEDELARQLGTGTRRHLNEVGVGARAALDEVAEATAAALAGGRTLTRDELHEELRGRVRDALLPWCRGCESHHVAPMLWRYAGVRAGSRLLPGRRYVLGDPGDAGDPRTVVRGFLRFYGPATAKDLGGWTGVASAHARRLWAAAEDELAEVRVGDRRAWVLAADVDALSSTATPTEVRLLPPRDPYLQYPDRAAVVADADLRKRVFRPVASPGVVLADGRIAGLWRVRAKGRRSEVAVDRLAAFDRDALEAEAERVAALREDDGVVVRYG